MGGTCSTYGRWERRIKGFGGEILEELDVDGGKYYN
jgi:hypothetical protein